MMDRRNSQYKCARILIVVGIMMGDVDCLNMAGKEITLPTVKEDASKAEVQLHAAGKGMSLLSVNEAVSKSKVRQHTAGKEMSLLSEIETVSNTKEMSPPSVKEEASKAEVQLHAAGKEMSLLSVNKAVSKSKVRLHTAGKVKRDGGGVAVVAPLSATPYGNFSSSLLARRAGATRSLSPKARLKAKLDEACAGKDITVGTFNVLATDKATLAAGGFPGFTKEALDMHNGLDDDKASIWLQKTLEDLMVSSSGPRISLLALQEVNKPMFLGLRKFVRKHKNINFVDVNGNHGEKAELGTKTNNIFKSKDPPYVVYYKRHHVHNCEPKMWGKKAKAVICNFHVHTLDAPLVGIFVHGDSNGPSGNLPEGKYDLVTGDFNVHDYKEVKRTVEHSKMQLAGGQGTETRTVPTLMRSVFDLRKLMQGIENSCGFHILCESAERCTCSYMYGVCVDENRDKGVHGIYVDKEETNWISVKTNSVVRGCKEAGEICGAFVKANEDGKVRAAASDEHQSSAKIPGEIRSVEGMEYYKEWLKKAAKPDYNWKDVLADLKLHMEEGQDLKADSCPAFPDNPAALRNEILREDWIAASPTTFSMGNAHVYKYAEAYKESQTKYNGIAPVPSWVSDHFPVYATLSLSSEKIAHRQKKMKYLKDKIGSGIKRMDNGAKDVFNKMNNGAKDVFNEMDNGAKDVFNKVTKAKDDVFGVQDGKGKSRTVITDEAIERKFKENKAKKEKRDDVKATKEMYANQEGDTKIDETEELTRDMTGGVLSNIFKDEYEED